jgi:hypothetical protein
LNSSRLRRGRSVAHEAFDLDRGPGQRLLHRLAGEAAHRIWRWMLAVLICSAILCGAGAPATDRIW